MLRKAALAAGCLLVLLPCTAAFAEFPYTLGGQPPSDLTGKRVWMYAASPEPGNVVVNADPRENFGIRGAHVVDHDQARETAWQLTTGDPDVTIAVLDSGIEWQSFPDMLDLREKTRINRGEAPAPIAGRATPTEPALSYQGTPDPNAANRTEPAPDCGAYRTALAAGGTDGDRYDLNGDGVFNILDYACDQRVDPDPARGVGPDWPEYMGSAASGRPVLDPQDVLIAFTDFDDDDGNGYDDDLVGWDFLDDDNDPFDDVRYGHGTGEALDSGAEGDNAVFNEEGDSIAGGELGTCPNCMQVHMRVGDSFIADVNRFAQATTYATDNDVEVVQEALGTLNNSMLSRQAVEYAYHHGVTVIASAADEAAQHNNWPSSHPHVILVNSVTKYPSESFEFPEEFEENSPFPFPFPDQVEAPPPGSPGRSYLEFNGCTNFNSKITVAIPSVSCSSDATGRAAGMAGLIYSAALEAEEAEELEPHPTCERADADGTPCLLSANEVRQYMATGTVNNEEQADDVRFTGPEPSCTTTPAAECTAPFFEGSSQLRIPFPPRSYPARDGHDQFYGYGRVNMRKAVESITDGELPPEAELLAPDWYSFVDPDQGTLTVRGAVGARGRQYTCRVLVAPGSYPNNSETTSVPPGDFAPIANGHCNGTSQHTATYSGPLGDIDINALKARFPPEAGDHHERETGASGTETSNGRPNDDPYGFVVKVVVSITDGVPMTAEDRRNFRLHRDQDMLDGFPRDIGGDGAASPAFADLDGDNENELILAGSDGIVHAYKRGGGEAAGWPVRVDRVPVHSAARAYASGEVTDDARAAILGSPAVGDVDRDGEVEVVVTDLEGKVTAFRSDGTRLFTQESNIAYSGKPLVPFQNVRQGPANRTQHGFIASPVLADLDRDDGGRLEVIGAAMDRHVYAWNDDGTPVTGYPVLVVDHRKVGAIDPQTHAVRLDQDAIGYDDRGRPLGPKMQGAIIDTPAVGDVAGDAAPEIVVGTNEEYVPDVGNEGQHAVSPMNAFAVSFVVPASGALDPSNTRLYAILAAGDPDGDARTAPPTLEHWPAEVGQSGTETLPIVGEGVTGAPVISDFECPEGGDGPKIGGQGHAGPSFVLNADTTSCYGNDGSDDNEDGVNDQPRSLRSDGGTGIGQTDTPVLNAFGHPVLADLGDGNPAYFTPALGPLRALDIGFPEYQGGQDFLGGWDATSGEFRPAYPARMNDLQFLTGPSIAEVDGEEETQELLAGSASLDLQGYNHDGTPIDDTWPKLTSDWMVANPLVGGWGDGETKVVVAITRSGFLLAYDTAAGVCDGEDRWPRFHHDNWNTGDARRLGDADTIQPGTPEDLRVEEGEVRYTAAGDDLMCGDAVRHEVRTSDHPITGENFEDADLVGSEPPAERRAPGDDEAVTAGSLKRFVAVRAIDDADNVGRVVAIDTAPPDDGDGDGGGDGPPGEGEDGRPPQTGRPPHAGGGAPPGRGPNRGQPCVPHRALRNASVRPSGRTLLVGIPAAAGPTTVDVFQQSVRRRLGDRLVARFRGRTKAFRWNGRSNLAGRRVRNGILFVRLRASGEKRRFALRRRRGRFSLRPVYYRPAHCRLMASVKLLRPVFGGRRNRPLTIGFRLTTGARVAVTVRRGRRTVRRYAGRRYPANDFFRLRLRARRRGDYRVRIVATAGGRRDAVTLVARRI